MWVYDPCPPIFWTANAFVKVSNSKSPPQSLYQCIELVISEVDGPILIVTIMYTDRGIRLYVMFMLLSSRDVTIQDT